MSIFGFEVAPPALGLGVLLGLNYALLAVGLVLVYRNSRLINFAHGDIGFGAAVLMWVATDAGVPYWVCFPLAVLVGGALAATMERSIVERLRTAPRAIAALATIGCGQLVFYIASTLLGATKGETFPQPPGLPTLRLETLLIYPADLLALVLTPVFIGGLYLCMTRSSWGLALRGAGADPDLMRSSGFHGGFLSASAWALSGGLSALTAMLLFGLEADSPPATGLDLLVPTLAAATVARMSSLVVAGVAGLALGVLQHLLLWNGVGGGLLSVALFDVVYVMFSLTRGTGTDLDKRTRWASIRAPKRLTFGRVRVTIVPLIAAMTGSAALMLLRPTDATTLTVVFAFVLVALSSAVVTGLSGQLLLGQAAYAGLGAFASVAVTTRTGNFVLGFLSAAIVGGIAALLSSLPALRRRDLSLAVLSLGFAFACVSWLFPQTWMFGDGVDPGRPIIGSVPLTTARAYGFFVLGVLCLGLWIASRLWHSPLARRLAAERDNPLAAVSFGISSPVVRAQALLISGAIAGVAGALLGHASISLSGSDFAIGEALRSLGGAALGGITSVSGAIWGTLFMVGLPSFVGGVLGFLAASWVGWLLVVAAVPHGLASVLARRAQVIQTQPSEVGVTVMPRSFTAPARPDTSGLDITRVTMTIGDLRALDDVSLQIAPGAIVGVVGRNGAGKSTLLDVVSGTKTPDRGTITLGDLELNGLAPQRRARAGLGRAFEGAILFPTLTVFETTLMALENPVSGATMSRHSKRHSAQELLGQMGLWGISDKKIGELSTGVRRIAQLACLAARMPRVLLLDEPASGIAQAELDGLTGVLRSVNADLGATIVVVEHDIRLIREVASFVYVLDNGRVVAEGTPEETLGRAGTQG